MLLYFFLAWQMSQSLWRKTLRLKEGIHWEITSCGNLEISLPKHKSDDLPGKDGCREMVGYILGRWKEYLTRRQTPSQTPPSPFHLNYTLSKFWAYLSPSIAICQVTVNRSVFPTFQGDCENWVKMEMKVFWKILSTDVDKNIPCFCKDTPSFHSYLLSLLIRSASKFNIRKNVCVEGIFEC